MLPVGAPPVGSALQPVPLRVRGPRMRSIADMLLLPRAPRAGRRQATGNAARGSQPPGGDLGAPPYHPGAKGESASALQLRRLGMDTAAAAAAAVDVHVAEDRASAVAVAQPLALTDQEEGLAYGLGWVASDAYPSADSGSNGAAAAVAGHAQQPSALLPCPTGSNSVTSCGRAVSISCSDAHMRRGVCASSSVALLQGWAAATSAPLNSGSSHAPMQVILKL